MADIVKFRNGKFGVREGSGPDSYCYLSCEDLSSDKEECYIVQWVSIPESSKLMLVLTHKTKEEAKLALKNAREQEKRNGEKKKLGPDFGDVVETAP